MKQIDMTARKVLSLAPLKIRYQVISKAETKLRNRVTKALSSAVLYSIGFHLWNVAWRNI